jgi:hypothetical protein
MTLRTLRVGFCCLLLAGVTAAQNLNCNLQLYKAENGLRAGMQNGMLTLTWDGESGQQLRASFTIQNGQPVVQELAAQKKGGRWEILARNLTPEFNVTSGKRRLSRTQQRLIESLGTKMTPEVYDARKWDTFWDAPLSVPGSEQGDTTNLPRLASEIRRARATYNAHSCAVKTEGERIEVMFPDSVSMGIFAGGLQYTVYRGSNLLRQEVIAKTEEPSVAYIYGGGLKGFAIHPDSKVVWRDTARAWQQYDFGGAKNDRPVNVRARNRLLILDSGSGSLAVFPPPHKFFFARENEVNLGYVYYRKDSDTSFAIGVMQPEQGEGYHPWGATADEWQRRSRTAEHQWENFALYNAPPGTMQRMAVYFYLSPNDDQTTDQAVLAYTHDDRFKSIPGFKTLVSHFHLDFNEMLRDRNNLDYRPPWVSVFRNLGVNIAILGDFHDDSHPRDPGPIRFMEEKAYFEGAERVSDKDFLVIPGEEPNSFLGGHWWMVTPRPVYFSHAEPRPAGQQYMENDPKYGTVYHLGSAEDVLRLVREQKGLLWMTHPRTKSSEGYPDAYKDKDFFLDDRFIGASWESLPVDLSEQRLCETRCFGTGDDMSNWAPFPKYNLAEGDTYTKWPDDETYPQLAVNYVKLDRVPAYNESWAPVLEALHTGNFYGTTGEVLFHNWGVEGSGAKRTYTANIEWTFPLDFAELVWSDGKKVDRQIIAATDLPPFGSKEFKIPFDATGKKWVRFAVWDSAGDGAFTQPVALTAATTVTSERR